MRILSIILLTLLLSCNSGSFEKRIIHPTNGYAQMVVIEQNGIKTLHISGQIGEGDDLEAQMRDVLDKLLVLLESEGAGYEHLIKINSYIVDYKPEDLATFRNVRKEVFTDQITPASTLVGVSSLALPEWLIEIDAVAVIEK